MRRGHKKRQRSEPACAWPPSESSPGRRSQHICPDDREIPLEQHERQEELESPFPASSTQPRESPQGISVPIPASVRSPISLPPLWCRALPCPARQPELSPPERASLPAAR